MIAASGICCEGNFNTSLLGEHGRIHVRHRIVHEHLEHTLEGGEFQNSNIVLDHCTEDLDVHALDGSRCQPTGDGAGDSKGRAKVTLEASWMEDAVGTPMAVQAPALVPLPLQQEPDLIKARPAQGGQGAPAAATVSLNDCLACR